MPAGFNRCTMILNFTRSWGFGIFRVYWVSKSKCIISSNLRAEGSCGKVLNVVIFFLISGPQVQLAFQRNWNSRKLSETVGNSRKQSGAARQKTSYLKPFKVHFLYKLVLNSSFFAESKVRAPTVSNGFPLHLPKKKRDCAESFFLQKNGGLTILAWSRRAAPDCFRLFPTVSDCFSFSGTPVGPVDHWFNKNHNIQHFSSRPFCSQVARNDAFWLWNPIYRKNSKTPRPREI